MDLYLEPARDFKFDFSSLDSDRKERERGRASESGRILNIEEAKHPHWRGSAARVSVLPPTAAHVPL